MDCRHLYRLESLYAGVGRLTTEVAVDALAEVLDAKLREWKPETAEQVRKRVAEVIELADQDVLDLLRSRAAEQDVLDMLGQVSESPAN